MSDIQNNFAHWTSNRVSKLVLSTVLAGAAMNSIAATPTRTSSMELHIRTLRTLRDIKDTARLAQRMGM